MTTDALKKLRQQFASRHHLRSSDLFRSSDVANAILQLLVKKGHETPDAFIKESLEIPFLADEVSPEELLELYELQRPRSFLLTESDLSKIEQDEYIRRIEAAFEERALSVARASVEAQEEQLKQMKHELEKGLAEIETFKSELDDIPLHASILDLANQTTEPERQEGSGASRSWWKEIGLEGDPFPSNQGLYGIPPEKYKDIIVETAFFNFYLDALKSDPEKVLGKTTLVVGEFGSGKTTLFHYMIANVGNSKILPILVNLNPHPSVSGLTSRMMEQIHDAMSESYSARFGTDPRREGGASDNLTTNLGLMRDLARDDITRGFLVFVDGLHKGDTYTDAVFEFLQQIQNVQEYFISHDVRVGFVVAGSPAWENELERRPSLSGSFYRKDTIPALSEQSAVQAVIRRLESYTPQSAAPPRVRSEDLRRTFNVLSSRLGRTLTFRDYLDHVRGRFEARDYQDLGLVVRLHSETVRAVKTALRRSILGPKYTDLWNKIEAQPILRYSCKRVLIAIMLKDGIGERHALFKDNKPAFFLLRAQGLIAQRRNTEDHFRWMLSPEFSTVVVQVAQDLHIGPDHVIGAAFEEEEAMRAEEAARIYSTPVSLISELTAAWRDSWPEVVGLLRRVSEILSRIDSLVAQGSYDQFTQRDLQASIELLVDALNAVNNGSSSKDEARWTTFLSSWYAPENAEAIKRFGESGRLPTNESALFGVLHEHGAVVNQVLKAVQDCVKGEAIARLQGRRLTLEECTLVHDARMNFLKQGYRQSVDIASGVIEERVREVIFPAMRAIWGHRAIDRLPPDIQKELERAGKRGHPRAKREADLNFLYDVSRSEYTKIAFESHIAKAVFGDLLDSRLKEQMREVLALAFSLNDHSAHRARPSYFREHATEIGDILKALPRLLELFHSVCARFVKGEVTIEKQSDGSITATFHSSEVLSPPAVQHNIQRKDVSSVTRALFEEMTHRDRILPDIGKSIAVGSVPPEVPLVVLCASHKFGAIQLNGVSGGPLVISLTDVGRRELEKSKVKPGQRTFEDTFN